MQSPSAVGASRYDAHVSTTDHPAGRGPGRKRDPRKERALLRAALEVYAEVGWSGFTFESVSRRANVGRPAIYLRWDSREDLLLGAFGALDLPEATTDTGDLEADLVALAEAFAGWWMSIGARAWKRLQLDHEVVPELAESFYRVQVHRSVRSAAATIERAIERGEVPAGETGIVVLEMINGAIYTRIFDTPPAKRGELDALMPGYVRHVAALGATLLKRPSDD